MDDENEIEIGSFCIKLQIATFIIAIAAAIVAEITQWWGILQITFIGVAVIDWATWLVLILKPKWFWDLSWMDGLVNGLLGSGWFFKGLLIVLITAEHYFACMVCLLVVTNLVMN